MKTLLLFLLLSSTCLAQNPQANMVWPYPGGPQCDFFVVETKNFNYKPELATNPVTDFAVGVDVNGDPLPPNEGHLHGWVFQLDRWGRPIRGDGDFPTPGSYLRFYGAGGADFVGNSERGYYILQDRLPRGRYRAYFQLQKNDHTALQQQTAPSLPGIVSVDFRVW